MARRSPAHLLGKVWVPHLPSCQQSYPLLQYPLNTSRRYIFHGLGGYISSTSKVVQVTFLYIATVFPLAYKVGEYISPLYMEFKYPLFTGNMITISATIYNSL